MILSVLFVCQGNICRSPALHALLEQRVAEARLHDAIFVDSCGLSASFIGCDVDRRIGEELKRAGIDFEHKAQLFSPAHFMQFDYIFAATRSILRVLEEQAPRSAHARLLLATAFSKRYPNQDIPDPYYGGEEGFASVFALIDDAAQGIFAHLTA